MEMLHCAFCCGSNRQCFREAGQEWGAEGYHVDRPLNADLQKFKRQIWIATANQGAETESYSTSHSNVIANSEY